MFDQSFHPQLSVFGNIFQHLMMYGMDKKAARKKTEEYLSLYNLSGVRKEKTSKLSLGMKQRLALILALIHEPDIVLLDEPDLGMDIVNLNYLMETLKNLAAKNITIIVSSHNISNIVMLSDRVCLLSNGSIKCIEDIKKDNPDTARAYLENLFIENYSIRGT
ncbi:MAG: ABC transporter ATP-binding protein [Clostridiaceae bacterium]|nr:ABC transporter ATP-binding protein [Clostridiaceae bacterium]